MKKAFVLAVLSAMMVCGNIVFAKKAKTFEGTITYKIGMSGNAEIEASMDMLPDVMKYASFSIKGSKAKLSLMGQCTFVDIDKKIVISQVDLSMLGMGTFCIENPYDPSASLESNAVSYTATGETKKIGDYTAEKYKAKTLSADGTPVESELWVTGELGEMNMFPTFPGLNGVPLEFEVNAATGFGSTKVKMSMDKVTPKKLAKEDVAPDDDCPRKTMDELQDILKVIQSFSNEEE